MIVMRFSSWFLPSSASLATLALFASTASAHIELIDPPPRYALPANKSCPCGDGDANRVCNVTAAESHDDNRSDNVTTLEAGSTITVTAEEYIDHAGRMRVAFDQDGADLADFNANILADESDPSEAGLSMATPHVWTFEVEVPNTPCENCTLQVIQVMQGGTENPVADPAALSTYYTCADIRIVPAGTVDDDGPSGDDDQTGAGGSAIVSAGGSAGAGDEDEPAGGRPGAGGRTAAGGSATASAAGSPPSSGNAALNDADASDEGGCSVASVGSRLGLGWALAPLAVLGGVLRRRRRLAR